MILLIKQWIDVYKRQEVYGYDPFISVEAAWKLSRDVHHTTDVNEIYRECDYITIHVPVSYTHLYNHMMEEIREAIEQGRYKEYKRQKLDGMEAGE